MKNLFLASLMLLSPFILDAQVDKLIFSDESLGTIRSLGITGDSLKQLVISEDPSDIVVDFSNDKIYWTDKNKGTLEEVSIAGSDRKTVLSGLNQPLSIAKYASQKHLYIFEKGKGQIFRCNYDGSDKQIIISSIVDGLDATIDTVDQKVYWSLNAGTIWRANLNGANKVSYATGLMDPKNIVIDNVSSKCYWNDASPFSSDYGIYSKSLTGTGAHSRLLIRQVKSFDIVNQKLYYSYGLNDSLFRASLDGTGSVGIAPFGFYKSVCMLGDSTTNQIYFGSLADGNYIQKISLGSLQIKMVAERFVWQVGQVAYNPKTKSIFWVNRSSNTATDTASRIVTLNDSGISQLFKDATTTRHEGVAFDWENELLYTNQAFTPFLKRSNFNGTNRLTLQSTGLGYPQYLRYNPEDGRIYISDRTQGKLSSIKNDGSDPKTITANLSSPSGFDIDMATGNIFIAESEQISVIHKNGGTKQVLITGLSGIKSVVVNQTQDEIYYTKSSTIHKARKDGTQSEQILAPTTFSYIFDMKLASVCDSLQQPGPIVGDLFVCIGDTLQYTSSGLPNGRFSWSFPKGWKLLDPNGSSGVQVVVGDSSGVIRCVPINNCGVGPASEFTVTVRKIPSLPSPIIGHQEPCIGDTITFNTSSNFASIYSWTFPSNWQITQGDSTAIVNVFVSSSSGTISLFASNSCGISQTQTLDVIPIEAPIISNISGENNPVQGTIQTYSAIGSVADSYQWIVPSDWSIISGNGTSVVQVMVGLQGGIIQVVATNDCGLSAPIELPVTTIVNSTDLPVTKIEVTPSLITNAEFKVCGSDEQFKFDIQVYNQFGTLISTLKEVSFNERIPFEAPNGGIYFMVLEFSNGKRILFKVLSI